MQIVIDIPEIMYGAIKEHGITFLSHNDKKTLRKSIVNGTPQPKMGRWIAQDIHNCHTNFKCSECNYIRNFTHLYGEPTADYTYCPRCGAKMEVEEDKGDDCMFGDYMSPIV